MLRDWHNLYGIPNQLLALGPWSFIIHPISKVAAHVCVCIKIQNSVHFRSSYFSHCQSLEFFSTNTGYAGCYSVFSAYALVDWSQYSRCMLYFQELLEGFFSTLIIFQRTATTIQESLWLFFCPMKMFCSFLRLKSWENMTSGQNTKLCSKSINFMWNYVFSNYFA